MELFKAESDVFHSVPILPDFLGPLQWLILMQSWKATVIKHHLVSDHS